jgi:DNA-binding CsgD family transcriptional regulator
MALPPLDRASMGTGEEPDPRDELTRAERNVLRVLTTGARNREIATRLCLSESTVRSHLTHIYAKFGVDGRAALIAALRDSNVAPLATPPSEAHRYVASAIVLLGLAVLLAVTVLALVLVSQPQTFARPFTGPQSPRMFGGSPEIVPTHGISAH